MQNSRRFDRHPEHLAKQMTICSVPGTLVLVDAKALWPIRARGRLERVHPV
jgi:hypothetical protein